MAKIDFMTKGQNNEACYYSKLTEMCSATSEEMRNASEEMFDELRVEIQAEDMTDNYLEN